jgi:hypothetical protein
MKFNTLPLIAVAHKNLIRFIALPPLNVVKSLSFFTVANFMSIRPNKFTLLLMKKHRVNVFFPAVIFRHKFSDYFVLEFN